MDHTAPIDPWNAEVIVHLLEVGAGTQLNPSQREQVLGVLASLPRNAGLSSFLEAAAGLQGMDAFLLAVRATFSESLARAG